MKRERDPKPNRFPQGRRDLALVLTAGLVSATGDWILATGLTYAVYALTGSTVASAAAVMATFAPQVLLSPVAGVLADRWDRKRTMVVTNLLMAAGLPPLMLVHNRHGLWIVVAVLVFQGAVRQFFAPAEQALLPRLVGDGDLVAANALAGQSRDIARLLGAGAGGVIAASGGIGALAIADTVSFLAAALLVVLIRTDGRVARTAGKHASAIFGQMTEGLRISLQERVLRILVVFILLTSIGEGVMGTLFAPFVREVLHGSSRAYGTIVAAQAIGGIVGGLVAAGLGERHPPVRLLTIGALIFGVGDLSIFLYPLGYIAVWPAVVGIILVGVPGALMTAGLLTIFQRHTADEYRGRVFGALVAVQGVCQLVATFVAGFAAESVGIVPVLAFQGICYLVAGVVVLIAVRDGRDRRGGGDDSDNGPHASTSPASGHQRSSISNVTS